MKKLLLLLGCCLTGMSYLTAAPLPSAATYTPPPNPQPSIAPTVLPPLAPPVRPPVSPPIPTPVAPPPPSAPAPAPVAAPVVAPPAVVQSPVVLDRSQEILDSWFGPLSGADAYPEYKATSWFSKTADNQKEMRDLYESDLMHAVKGDYNDWRKTPRGRLALILLLDQIPRNIYGEKPQAFATDRMAQGLVMEGLQKGDDQKLLPVERAFFYLPLVHAEDAKLQDLAVYKYQELVNEAPAANRLNIQEFLTYAMIHRDVINKFGRFPFRNAIYDRKSTPEEINYLKEWGSYPN